MSCNMQNATRKTSHVPPFTFYILVLGMVLAARQISESPAASPMPSFTPAPATVSGIVRGEDGPIAGATVRVQAADTATLTDDEGRFTLTGLSEGVAVTIGAWKHTYY